MFCKKILEGILYFGFTTFINFLKPTSSTIEKGWLSTIIISHMLKLSDLARESPLSHFRVMLSTTDCCLKVLASCTNDWSLSKSKSSICSIGIVDALEIEVLERLLLLLLGHGEFGGGLVGDSSTSACCCSAGALPKKVLTRDLLLSAFSFSSFFFFSANASSSG